MPVLSTEQLEGIGAILEIPTKKMWSVELVRLASLKSPYCNGMSRGEARRLLKSGSVKLNGNLLNEDKDIGLQALDKIQVGKKSPPYTIIIKEN